MSFDKCLYLATTTSYKIFKSSQEVLGSCSPVQINTDLIFFQSPNFSCYITLCIRCIRQYTVWRLFSFFSLCIMFFRVEAEVIDFRLFFFFQIGIQGYKFIIIFNRNYMRYTTWFEIHIHGEIVTVMLMNILISSVTFFYGKST